MMKRSITLFLIISIFFLSLLTPSIKVNAKTLKDYKNEVAKLEAEKNENNRLSAEAEAKIDRMQNAIIEAENTIANNEKKVEDSKVLVAESQETIKVKTEELKDIINIYQYSASSSSEVYIDYVFSSSSISQMMERQAIVEQIMDYTQTELDSLEQLIVENEQLQTDLANNNTTLSNSITNYEKQQEELHHYIDELGSIGLNVEEQLKAQKDLVKMFEAAGCKDNDSVDDCYYNKKLGSSSFSRPTNSGYITQAWSATHGGIDIGVSKGTKVYAAANGTIISIQNGPAYLKKYGYKSCGGNIIYMHHTVNGKAYTTEYAHLTDMYVKVGQYVTKGTVIGTSGGDRSTFYYDRCTSGSHLHYSIGEGYYLGAGEYGYKSKSLYNKKTFPTADQKVSGLKSKKGWTWSSRN